MPTRFLTVALAIAILLTAVLQGAAEKVRVVVDWTALLDTVRDNSTLADHRDKLVTIARRIATRPIVIASELLPDNTVTLGDKVGPDYLHKCVIVRTEGPCRDWTLKTKVRAK